jgi:type III secretion protein T
VSDSAQIGALVGAVGLALPRIAAAFLVLPFFGADAMPAMVRNSFFVALALVVAPLAAASAPAALPVGAWPAIVAKEVFVGLMIGFAFGVVFWAIAAAGSIIDAKAGATGTVYDPLAGHQTSLTGQFYARLGGWIFMASGGFLVFLDVLLGSYALWPVASGWPKLSGLGERFVIDGFARLMALALLVAAPVLAVLLLVDFAFGLVNRYAPQLNAFALSLGVKSWLATLVVLLGLGVVVEFVVKRVAAESALLESLRQLF